jgi:hypothetical protein
MIACRGLGSKVRGILTLHKRWRCVLSTILSPDEDFVMLIEWQAALSPSSGEKKNSSYCCMYNFELFKFHSQVFC